VVTRQRISQLMYSNIDHPKCNEFKKKAKYLKEYTSVITNRLKMACVRFYLDDDDDLGDEIDETMIVESAFQIIVTSFPAKQRTIPLAFSEQFQ